VAVVVVVACEVGAGEGSTLAALGRPEEVVLAIVPEAQPAITKPRARTRPANRRRKRPSMEPGRFTLFRNTICVLTSQDRSQHRKGTTGSRPRN